jgi:thioredoxin-dependent peroxiredoxin
MSTIEGTQAHPFSLPASGNRTVSSDALKGRPYVLYFYPKADTSGCTKEAQSFQALLAKFRKKEVEVIGVSRDPVKALDKFATKYGLEFPLASDDKGELTGAYGVWIEKSMYGRKYMGIERSTVLVGADGNIIKAWPKVKIDGHAEEVLSSV